MAALRGRLLDQSGSTIEGSFAWLLDGEGRVLAYVAGASGGYRMDGLPPGKYTLMAYGEGFNLFHKTVELEANREREVNIELIVAALDTGFLPPPLLGFVKDGKGNPISEATVTIVGEFQNVVAVRKTNQDGFFIAECEGKVKVVIDIAGFERVERRVRMQQKKTNRLEIVLNHKGAQ